MALTIKELYTFAQIHNLQDKNIGFVIDEYLKYISVHNSTLASGNTDVHNTNITGSRSSIDYKNKVEFSTEDVLELFST